jgi:hypothetical protein
LRRCTSGFCARSLCCRRAGSLDANRFLGGESSGLRTRLLGGHARRLHARRFDARGLHARGFDGSRTRGLDTSSFGGSRTRGVDASSFGDSRTRRFDTSSFGGSQTRGLDTSSFGGNRTRRFDASSFGRSRACRLDTCGLERSHTRRFNTRGLRSRSAFGFDACRFQRGEARLLEARCALFGHTGCVCARDLFGCLPGCRSTRGCFGRQARGFIASRLLGRSQALGFGLGLRTTRRLEAGLLSIGHLLGMQACSVVGRPALLLRLLGCFGTPLRFASPRGGLPGSAPAEPAQHQAKTQPEHDPLEVIVHEHDPTTEMQ